jgi:peptidoglycan/xylan/chitin deacetylase (PgdA/CDA1 family)
VIAGPPLHVDSASLQSRGAELRVTLHTEQAWTAAALTPEQSRSLCVRFGQDGLQTRICPVRGTTTPLALRWSRLNAAGHPVQSRDVPGRATHPDAHTLRARFRYTDTGLLPGRYTWRVEDGTPTSGDELPTGCTPRGPGEVFNGPAGQKRIALTFDDGPDRDTSKFLDLLERERVPATFFMIGRQVAAHASLLTRMLRDGDMIGNHTYNHAHVANGGSAEIAETNAAIRKASGFTPCLFRPPYGESGPALVSELQGLGMRSIRWDVDPADWRLPGADAIVDNVLHNAHDGAIVISHDGGGSRAETLAAYARIIPALRTRGYRFVTVTDLLGYPLT